MIYTKSGYKNHLLCHAEFEFIWMNRIWWFESNNSIVPSIVTFVKLDLQRFISSKTWKNWGFLNFRNYHFSLKITQNDRNDPKTLEMSSFRRKIYQNWRFNTIIPEKSPILNENTITNPNPRTLKIDHFWIFIIII